MQRQRTCLPSWPGGGGCPICAIVCLAGAGTWGRWGGVWDTGKGSAPPMEEEHTGYLELPVGFTCRFSLHQLTGQSASSGGVTAHGGRLLLLSPTPAPAGSAGGSDRQPACLRTAPAYVVSQTQRHGRGPVKSELSRAQQQLYVGCHQRLVLCGCLGSPWCSPGIADPSCLGAAPDGAARSRNRVLSQGLLVRLVSPGA